METRAVDAMELQDRPTTSLLFQQNPDDRPLQQPGPASPTGAGGSTPGSNNNRSRSSTGPAHSTAFLDGLRGLAAFFVFVQHMIGGFDANVHEHGFGQDGNYYFASLPFVRIVFSGGSAAVAIFFVLSGYVLSKSPLGMLRKGNRPACVTSLISAVIRRPIRLYIPPLAVTLLYALLLHAPFDFLPGLPWASAEPTVFAELWKWLTLSLEFFSPFRTHGSNQAWYPYNLVVWTIPIELKGSMLIYALVGVYAFAGVPLLISLALYMISVTVMLIIGRWTMACFVAGLILSYIDVWTLDTPLLNRYLTQRAQSILMHVIFFVGFYLICQPAHAGKPEYSGDTPGWHTLTALTPAVYDKDQYFRFWHSWGSLLLVYATLRIRWLQNFLHTRPLRYLGKVSFILYLIHLPIFYIYGNRVYRVFGMTAFGGDPYWFDNLLWVPDIGPRALSLRFLICVAAVLPVCLILSDFGTRVLDVPSVKIGKKLVERLGLTPGRSSRKAVDTDGPILPEHTVHLSQPN